MEIMMSISKCILVTFLTLHLISTLTLSVAPTRAPDDMTIGEACRLTRYRQVCVDTLGYFDINGSQTTSPYEWACQSVDMVMLDVQTLNWTLVTIVDTDQDLTSDEKRAVTGCINDTAAALVDVQNSLQILTNISSGSERFGDETSEVQTHLRSVMRNEDSCTKRMSEAGNGQLMVDFANMTTMSTQITDNALALNKYLAKVGMSPPPES